MSKICEWQSSRSLSGCHRYALEGRQYCIFHLPEKTSGEIAEFDHALGTEIRRQLKANRGLLCFNGFRFPNHVVLSEVLVRDRPSLPIEYKLEFHDSLFRDGLTVKGIVFGEEVSFARATFENHASFENVTFKKYAGFAGAISKSGLSFSDSTFEGPATFTHSDLGLSFLQVTFKEGAFFDGAEITGFGPSDTFRDVSFRGPADFKRIIFRRDVRLFQQVTFLSDVRLRPAPQRQNGSIVSLCEVKFSAKVELDMSEFLDPKIKTSVIIVLRDCYAEEHANLILKGAMGCFSLLGTDLSRVEFVDESWSPRHDLLGSVKAKERRAVLEEYLLERKANYPFDLNAPDIKGLRADGVAQLYRRLRDKYESSKRYAEAGDFFVGEMEILRKYKTVQTGYVPWGMPYEYIDRPPVKRPWYDPYRLFLLEPYRLLAAYGESVKRPAIVSVITIALFAVLRLFLPPIFSLDPIASIALRLRLLSELEQLRLLSAIGAAIEESTFAFFQLQGTTSLDLAERLASAPILGLLFVALRRKLERH